MGVRNGLPYLQGAISSVLGQTFEAFELIVVDDASDDGTTEILESITDPRVAVLRNDENVGLTRSLNRALGAARGRFVARQDSDDRSLPQRIERQLAYLERHDDIVLCGSWARFVDAHGRRTAIGRPPAEPGPLAQALLASNVMVHGSILARREAIEAAGGYREAFRYAQDYDLYLRLIERHRIANLAEPLYELRYHDAAISRDRGELQSRYAALARDLAEQRRARGGDDLDAGADVSALLAAQPAASSLEYRRHAAMHRRLSGDLNGYRRALLELVRGDRRDPRHYAHLLLTLGGRRALMAADRLAALISERRGG
jgi:glycosyltransferase involved in cell wall biosynthesis